MGGVGIPTIIPEQKEEPVDGGGMLKGKDGKWSIRRISGFASFIFAAGVAVYGLARLPVDRALAWSDAIFFLPSALFIVLGAYLLRMITNQNISEIVGAVKGKKE